MTTGERSLARRLARAVRRAVAAAGVLLLVPAAPVSAHAELDRSVPAANSVLESPPAEVLLDFDESVQADLALVRMYDADGERIALGHPRVGGDASVVVAAVPTIADGLYAVVWRVTSDDGHVVEGAFSFVVGAGAAGSALSGGQSLIAAVRADAFADPVVRGWLTATRSLGYLAAIVLLGGGWWITVGGSAVGAGRRDRRVLQWSAALLAASTAATFGLFGAQALGGSVAASLSPSVWGQLAPTRTGALLLARLALALVWLVLVSRRSLDRRPGTVEAVLALCVLCTFAAVGHAGVTGWAAWWILVDLVHLAAMACWLGGLSVLAMVPRAAYTEPGGAATRFARRFSRTALVLVPVVVVSGGALAWRLADGWSGIADTEWGDRLIAKVITVAVLLCAAAVARLVLHRRSARSMWGTVVLEVALGVVVVVMAAGLVARSPEPPRPAQPFAEQLAAPSGMISIVSISPGSVGSNEFHVVVTPPGGSLTRIADVSARVSLHAVDGSAVIPVAPVSLRSEGVNHWSGTVLFPRSGAWTLELLVQVTATEEQVLKATVPIP